MKTTRFLSICMLFCAALCAGCMMTGRPKLGSPVNYKTVVYGDKGWQYSGVRVNAHQIIECNASGRWGYRNEMYPPDGDPRNMKWHHGINAPTFGLIMRLSGSTNLYYRIGSYTNVVAPISGHIYFRSNVSLPDGVQGKVDLDMRVCHDADRDGICDYDEVHVWGTDPFRADTDGDGFTDFEKIEYRRRIQRMREGRVSGDVR